jgi:agmatine deiminase
MPAEWTPHEATWLAWPHERTDWPGKFAPIHWVYADIVKKLSLVERVRVLVQNESAERQARSVVRKGGANLDAVEFFQQPTNRSWCRDFCPIFVKSEQGEIAITNWLFNGWAKYDNWQEDNAVPAALAKRFKLLRAFEPGIVLEGGSIDVNGAGKLLTTEECLLSEDVQIRNPGLRKADIESYFAKYLGVTETIWLNKGIEGDDTHGHIDDVARFVDENTVVLVEQENRENLERLERSGLRVVLLPMPQPIFFDGQRLPASYANFYIANKLVLVPTFNDPSDRIALDKLAELFPGRQIAGIHSLDLVLGLGTLHCLTMQQPS